MQIFEIFDHNIKVFIVIDMKMNVSIKVLNLVEHIFAVAFIAILSYSLFGKYENSRYFFVNLLGINLISYFDQVEVCINLILQLEMI